MVDRLLEQIEHQEDIRAALSQLRAELKEETAHQRARELTGNGALLKPLLHAEDAKIRKNAAAVLGDLGAEEMAAALYEAYQKETTLFVRPVLLRALEKTDPYPYLSGLKDQYDLLCAKDAKEEEKKHVREEIRALGRILRREGEGVRHTFAGWDQRVTILLTSPSVFSDLTKEQLKARRTGPHPLGVQAVVEDLREVIGIRTFRELLFPIGLGKKIRIEDGPEALGEALAGTKLLSLLERCHLEPSPFCFRFDLRGGYTLEERSRYLKRAAAVLEEQSGRKLCNAPEEYEFELRLMTDKAKNIHVFLKMCTIPMDRFAYRRKAVSASIHPSAAASLLRLAKPYLKKNAQILDPCCGVGTMLVERHKLLPAREIYGIDTFGEAIAGARINVEAAGMHVNFIHKDYLDFEHGYLFDEIIANLPMRGKRAKEEQDAFYRGFFDQSQKLLAPDGIMLLYSNENGFVKKQLRLHKGLRLCKEYLISEKEQFYFYVIGTGNVR